MAHPAQRCITVIALPGIDGLGRVSDMRQ
jgi:hypothetical protein